MTPDNAARRTNGAAQGGTRTLVLHPWRRRERGGERSPEARLAEAEGLARAIELDVVAAHIVPLGQIRPGTLFGSGKVAEIGAEIATGEIELVVVDHALSAIQHRNLERAWKCKVIDRTGLILEIFGARARTREGRLQVELAALNYQRSRLVRSWTHLERQRGGFGFLGGPGETQIEADRRQILERISRIRLELEDVVRTRGLHRHARQRVPYPTVALVGYTNAGKSTLFNRLSGAEVRAEDRLFATLDPTMRRIRLPSGRQVILSDTVGFVSDLPTDLVAAFRATLEEVVAADLILHVRDASHPETEAQCGDVLGVLGQLGIDAQQQGRVLELPNKVDRLGPDDRARWLNNAERRGPMALPPVSAITGEGCDTLLAAIDAHLAERATMVDVSVDLGDGALIAWLYRNGTVAARQDDERHAHLRVALDPVQYARFLGRRQMGARPNPVDGVPSPAE